MRSLVTTALTLVLSTALPGQDNYLTTRMAVYSPERVIEKSPRAKKIFAEMEELNKKLSGELKIKFDKLQDLENKLKSSNLNEETRSKLLQEFQDGELAFKRLQEDSNVKFQKVQNDAMIKFDKDINPILLDMGKELKLQMIWRWNPQIMYPIDEVSFLAFSDEVAKRYEKHGGGASSSASTTKPAPKPQKPNK